MQADLKERVETDDGPAIPGFSRIRGDGLPKYGTISDKLVRKYGIVNLAEESPGNTQLGSCLNSDWEERP